MNQLIRCINCDEVFLKTPFDQMAGIDDLPTFPRVLSTRLKRRFQDFMKDHHGHRLENLKCHRRFLRQRKDLHRTGQGLLLQGHQWKREICRSKDSGRGSMSRSRYQLIQGDYSLKCHGGRDSARMPSQNNCKWNCQRFPFTAGEDRCLSRKFSIRSLETLEIQTSGEGGLRTPLILSKIYYKLDDVSLAYLLRNCRNIFKGPEYRRSRPSSIGHKDDGVLLLKANYAIQFEWREPTREEPFRFRWNSIR